MDDEYERIYELLYSEAAFPDDYYYPEFRRPPLQRGILRGLFPFDYRIRRLIESADAKLRDAGRPGLRSDAKLILFINLVDMIALPIAAVGTDIGYLGEALDNDVNLLVTTAAEGSAGDTISAHAMVGALYASWDKLALAQTRLWGASRR